MSIFQTTKAKMTQMNHATSKDTPDFFLNPTIKTMATAMGSADRIAIKKTPLPILLLKDSNQQQTSFV